MIVNLLIAVFVSFITVVFYLLPEVSLPSALSSILGTIGTTWNAFIDTFPYAQTATTIFWWIVAFEGALLLAKFFLGHRVPAHMN